MYFFFPHDDQWPQKMLRTRLPWQLSGKDSALSMQGMQVRFPGQENPTSFMVQPKKKKC